MSEKNLLKLIIDENHISQTYLADYLGVTKQYVSQVYNDKGKLSQANLKKLRLKFPEYFPSAQLPSILDATSIKDYRIANQYSQTDFARLLSIKQPTLARIEDGSLPISESVNKAFYNIFGDKSEYYTVNYCPEVSIPDNFVMPTKPDTIRIDKRLLTVLDIDINYNQTYLVTIKSHTLKPEYENNDRVLLDTSQKVLRDGYVYLIKVGDVK